MEDNSDKQSLLSVDTELNILIVEDNPADAFLIQFYLEESLIPRFRCQRAEQIRDALELLQNNKFDVLLLDLNLPDSLGVKSIQDILRDFPDNIIIVLTGITDEKIGLESVRYGAQDFLVKGRFDSKMLISSLRFSYERYQLNQKISQTKENVRLVSDRMNDLLSNSSSLYLEIEDKQVVFRMGSQKLELHELESIQEIIQGNTALPCQKVYANAQSIARQLFVWKRNDTYCVLVSNRI